MEEISILKMEVSDKDIKKQLNIKVLFSFGKFKHSIFIASLEITDKIEIIEHLNMKGDSILDRLKESEAKLLSDKIKEKTSFLEEDLLSLKKILSEGEIYKLNPLEGIYATLFKKIFSKKVDNFLFTYYYDTSGALYFSNVKFGKDEEISFQNFKIEEEIIIDDFNYAFRLKHLFSKK